VKRPWNRTNQNIYSLMTTSEENILNMNICTYVSVVNMNPKMYAIAIDFKTLTYSNLINNNRNTVLQALSKKNLNLIRYLGKKSGYNYDKNKYLIKNKLTTNWRGYSILKNSAFLLELTHPKEIYKMNDHNIFIFKIKSFKNINENLLTYNDLIKDKIIL